MTSSHLGQVTFNHAVVTTQRPSQKLTPRVFQRSIATTFAAHTEKMTRPKALGRPQSFGEILQHHPVCSNCPSPSDSPAAFTRPQIEDGHSLLQGRAGGMPPIAQNVTLRTVAVVLGVDTAEFMHGCSVSQIPVIDTKNEVKEGKLNERASGCCV